MNQNNNKEKESNLEVPEHLNQQFAEPELLVSPFCLKPGRMLKLFDFSMKINYFELHSRNLGTLAAAYRAEI